MSVELIPKAEYGCFEMSLANGTWFTLCNGPLKAFLGEQCTNDPMDVGIGDAILCYKALGLWRPPKGWFTHGREEEGKEMIKEFFLTCEGFTTS